MSTTRKNSNTAQFFLLSAFFWISILLASVLWRTAYHLMAQFITMGSEYSLLEQGTKLLLLFMIIISLIAYRNQKDRTQILLGLTFLLFAAAMYFSESKQQCTFRRATL